MKTEFISPIRYWVIGIIYCLPYMTALLGAMLVLETFKFELLGAALLLASFPIYKICDWIADKIWDDEGDVL